MNWNDAAEDFLNQVLAQTPRPVRDATEAQLRGAAEGMAEAEGKNRVGVETVIAAWVASTPETLARICRGRWSASVWIPTNIAPCWNKVAQGSRPARAL